MKSLQLPSWLGWPRLDFGLFAALLAIAMVGLFVLYSATDQDSGVLLKQAIRLGVGFAILIFFSQVPPYVFRLWTPWIYLAGIVLLLATWVFGEGRGAQRWLDVGLVRFQPSELMKLAVPMMVAWYLHDRILPPGWRDVLISLLLVGLPAVLIFKQPDLGTALLVAVSGGFTLYLAGLSWAAMGWAALLVAISAPLAWQYLMHEYQRGRIITFLNPENDPLGTGWNIIQSKIAAGSGGFTGKGWMNGTQSHLEFIPERSTDFILAVYAEEFGFVGILGLLALYVFVIYRCLYIATVARDTYARLLAGAMGLTFFVYVLVNFGMVTGLLPVVGIPLPLISYGGTSIVTLLASFGLFMSIYGYRKFSH